MTFKVGDKVVTNSQAGMYGAGTVFEVTGFGPGGYLLGDPNDYGIWPQYVDEYNEKNNYYDFPGGVEVRQISAHLTGFGAQALQYVARATRLDGKNKGDVVSDLSKAIDFIRWEIERLQGESK